MDNNNEKFSVDTENLKNETKQTYEKVKEQIKDVNIKNDAKETTSFIKELFLNPIAIVTKVAKEEENNFKRTILLIIVFIIETFIIKVISLVGYHYNGIFENILEIIKAVLNPLLVILVPSIIILLLNKENKKSLTTIISTIVVANIPRIISKLVSVLAILFTRVSFITSPICSTLSAIAIVFEYYGMKALFGKEDEDFIKKFALIKVITYFILYLV